MNIAGCYWFFLIKLCRFLIYLRLPNVAEWIAQHSGLKARLAALVDG